MERDGFICRHCGHGNAREADHWPMDIATLRAEGLDPDSAEHLVASHGVNSPCGVCGCRANQRRNGRHYRTPAQVAGMQAGTDANDSPRQWYKAPAVPCPWAGRQYETPRGVITHPLDCPADHATSW